MKFKDKVIFITGAASGIGKCAARSFSKNNGKVILTDIEEKSVKNISKKINSEGGCSVFYKLDVCNINEIDYVVEKCIKQFSKIDILVNSAGIYKFSPILKMSEKEWDETINVNLKGTFLCCQRVAKEMVKRKQGKIICISSIAAQKGAMAGRSHYGAAKGGILSFSKALALELIPFGINVNCIAPGLIKTEMTKELINKHGKEIIKSIPIAKPGTPQNVVDTILFLASTKSSYITGCTIDINGGSLMR